MNRELSRRDFMKRLGLGLGVAAFAGCAGLGTRAERPLPNIVFILADDMGYGDLSCQNMDSKIRTHCMDQLAAEGIRFTDAHTCSAVCTPTRYGLLTGRYAWRSRLKSGVLWGYSPPLIEEGRTTVASFLKDHGYTTACVGKWHLGLGWATEDLRKISDRSKEKGEGIDYSKPIQGGPLALGFDYFFGIPASLDMVPYVYIENDRVLAPPTETIEGRGGLAFYRGGPAAPGFDHETTLPYLLEEAMNFIHGYMWRKEKRPFFLYFALPAPHTPVLPTPLFRGTSRAGPYGDFVHQVDDTVADLMRTLEGYGLSENTLVMVTSDNGSTMKPMKEYSHLPNHFLRGRKSDVWDGGHRVPFIAWWPGVIEEGTVSDRTICITDLLATCAELVDSPLPPGAGEDSFSYLPALEGRTGPQREAVVHHSIDGMFAIRKGQWKLIEGKGSGGWTKGGEDDPAPGQLYDMKADPEEKKNLYLQQPEKVAELQGLLDAIRNR